MPNSNLFASGPHTQRTSSEFQLRGNEIHARIIDIAEKHCNQPQSLYTFFELQNKIDNINNVVSDAVATEIAINTVAVFEVIFRK